MFAQHFENCVQKRARGGGGANWGGEEEWSEVEEEEERRTGEDEASHPQDHSAGGIGDNAAAHAFPSLLALQTPEARRGGGRACASQAGV